MSAQPDCSETPPPVRTLEPNPPEGHPSAGLLARAQRGWNAFLARTGPLPGNAEEAERSQTDEQAGR